jgi:hypothetical protein
MQSQRGRLDQTYWQDVTAVNQNDPIQAVACTRLEARLETWTCLTTILLQCLDTGLHYDTDMYIVLERIVSLLFTSF